MSPGRTRERAPIAVPLCLLVGAVVALQLGYSEPGLLYLAPALLLLAALACDWYPGERLLAAVVARSRPDTLRARPESPRSPSPPRSSPRGGVLLAMALAGRGPPG